MARPRLIYSIRLLHWREACITGIRSSVRLYEAWLREQLGDAFVRADLKLKHEKMEEEPFLFLRATCWRWAETAHEICPELIGAPAVASIGDAHAGNFGLWRDAEGRLVWGVNDFDEAAVTPWPLDLVRLAASALLVDKAARRTARETAAAILEGYDDGLRHPAPFVLERNRLWLRNLFATADKDRSEFWKELQSARRAKKRPPGDFLEALAAALPEPGLEPSIAPRVAGAGSLGRLRLVASLEDYRGGPLAREAKALVPSCWDRQAAPGALCGLASGAYRSPDPWLRLDGRVVVRRLAPNSRKLDLGKQPGRVRLRLLKAMAADIAGVHAADRERLPAVREDFGRRKAGWLRAAARAVAEATERDWKAYRSR
ncbi:MAG TPA: DUF2252 family protein [Allosphingosinicella sp.]|nr:DUF2252 family protein [Allosphingosinicella sp.]